jgi:hypothetical protein
VLIVIALILGVMALVIFGFLSTSGIFSFDSRDALYQGVLDEKYREKASGGGKPLEAETIELLNDAEYFKAATDPAESGEEAGDAGDSRSDAVRVLLFLESGKLAAQGNVTERDNTFSLVKTVDFSEIERASEAPHLNRERDMLTYRDVDNALKSGGFFRVESGGRYISEAITPESPELLQ